MKKTSTQLTMSTTTTSTGQARPVGSPRRETLAKLRQFARSYCPVSTNFGVILN